MRNAHPFAINLSFAAAGIIFTQKVDISYVIKDVLDLYEHTHPPVPHKKLQKSLASDIKPDFSLLVFKTP